MKEFDKRYIDLDYIEIRDKIIKYLVDYDKSYTLYDSKRIRQIMKLLLKYLKKGSNND